MIDYDKIVYLDQNRDLNILYKEYFGGPLLNAFIYNTGVKNWYPFQVIDLRSQVDHINPKKFNYLKNVQILLKLTG